MPSQSRCPAWTWTGRSPCWPSKPGGPWRGLTELTRAPGGRGHTGSRCSSCRSPGWSPADPEGVAILPPAGEVTGIPRLLLSKADDAERQVLRLLATLDGAEIAAPHIA